MAERDRPDPDLPPDGSVLSHRGEKMILVMYCASLLPLVAALVFLPAFDSGGSRAALLVAIGTPMALLAVRRRRWHSSDRRGFAESVAMNVIALGAVALEPKLWGPAVVLVALLSAANMATAGQAATLLVVGASGVVLLVEALVLDVQAPLGVVAILLVTPAVLAGLESKRRVRQRRSYAVLYLRHGMVTGKVTKEHDVSNITVTDINPAAMAMFSVQREEFVGRLLTDVLPWMENADLGASLSSSVLGPRKSRRHLPLGDGRVIDIDLSTLPNREVAFTFTDVTGQVAAEQTIRRQAEVDALTGLANRSVLIAALDDRLTGDRRRVRPFALLMVDLNRFKEINDTFGHHVGDQALGQIAEELKNAARPTDLVARVGGDEFAIIVDDPDGPLNAIEIAERFAIACEKPVEIAGMRVITGASVGVVLVPEDGNDTETIMRGADTAMYEAKRSGERVRILTRASAHRDGDRLALSSQIDTAFARSEFFMLAQPKVNLRSGYVTGVELLARWRHPERGIIQPANFIDLIELAGRSADLARLAARAAVEGLAELDQTATNLDTHHAALNLSPRDFADPGLPAFIEELLSEYRVEPGRLLLEVTEDQVFDQLDGVEAFLDKLIELGVRLSIDDFGTGHSNLLRLNYLPVAEIKLDKYFIEQLLVAPEDVRMVRSVVELGHNLGLTVTAEGVEDQRQADVLRQIGCDQAQGFLWAVPIPVSEAMALIGTKVT